MLTRHAKLFNIINLLLHSYKVTLLECKNQNSIYTAPEAIEANKQSKSTRALIPKNQLTKFDVYSLGQALRTWFGIETDFIEKDSKNRPKKIATIGKRKTKYSQNPVMMAYCNWLTKPDYQKRPDIKNAQQAFADIRRIILSCEHKAHTSNSHIEQAYELAYKLQDVELRESVCQFIAESFFKKIQKTKAPLRKRLYV